MQKLKHLAKIAAATACVSLGFATQAFFLMAIVLDIQNPYLSSYLLNMSFVALTAFVLTGILFASLDEITPYVFKFNS